MAGRNGISISRHYVVLIYAMPISYFELKKK